MQADGPEQSDRSWTLTDLLNSGSNSEISERVSLSANGCMTSMGERVDVVQKIFGVSPIGDITPMSPTVWGASSTNTDSRGSGTRALFLDASLGSDTGGRMLFPKSSTGTS